jgi:cysteine desulfurase
MIYLDHNATTPILPEALEAMTHALGATGNPSSVHRPGKQARKLLEECREKVSSLLGATPDEVTFTSGATESNNIALFGSLTTGCHAVATPIEHLCVIEPLRQLQKTGVAVTWSGVGSDGVVLVDEFIKSVRPDTTLAALQLVNHETGAIQPVAELVQHLPNSVRVHCDAAQAVGKVPVNFHQLGVSTLSASAHKFRGPMGVGLLLVRRGTILNPRAFGGHQQRGLRPGTESVALAVGLTTALKYAQEHQSQQYAHLFALREAFQSIVMNALPEAMANSSANALPSTLNISFPGVRAELLLIALDLAGVACSTGSACSSGSLLPSPVLEAMHVGEARLHSAMRFSFGVAQPLEEVEEGAHRVVEAVKRLS